MKKLLLLAALGVALHAQPQPQYIYQSSTTAVTIQRPTTANRQMAFSRAWVYCAAAQTATLKWNGTAATATASTPTAIPGAPPAQAVAYTASNVGSGTTGATYAVGAGATLVIDLTPFTLGGGSTNLTISTDGTCTIAFNWSEY